jgi:hypothetical protein
MWPLSAKAGIKKMRSYQKKKRTIDDVEDDSIELPTLPPTRPQEIWTTSATVRALGDRDSTQFSEPSVQLFHHTMHLVDVQLQKSHLISLEHTALQTKIQEEQKRKTNSRRSIHKGGPSASVQDLRDKIKIRDEAEKVETLQKAQKRLVQTINKARNLLKSQGIQARKDEKARLERLKEYTAKDELPPLEDLVSFREPDKNPTELERLKCTEDFYPKLV